MARGSSRSKRNEKHPRSAEVQEVATKIGDALDDARLDGRDINSKVDGLRGISPQGAIVNLAKIIPMLVLLPTIILGMGLQMFGARLLGDDSDEGLDARTSYHLLFGMFGSLFLWPILATIFTIISVVFNKELDSALGFDWTVIIGTEMWHEVLAMISLWISLIILFWLSAVSFANGWDAVSDSAKWARRRKMNSQISPNLVKLRELLK